MPVRTQPAAWPLAAARWCVKPVDHKPLLLHRVPGLFGLHTPVASLRLGRRTALRSVGLHKCQRECPEGPDNLPVYCKQMPAAVGCMRSMPVGAVACMRLMPVEVRHMRSCCSPAVGFAWRCHSPAAHPREKHLTMGLQIDWSQWEDKGDCSMTAPWESTENPAVVRSGVRAQRMPTAGLC